ncbi:MAG TPA: OB-fold nucleic acid binding domain-containing protein, partial [Solirubrobacterales bacterium]|nr:OB-fold nucleic acid binding domain-containing protein [Solirubrobacterales bacterium]
LGYVKGVREEEMESLVAERERGGDYRGIADLASRSGAGSDGLERLAWAGALDPLVGREGTNARPVAGGGRREALWEAGGAGTGIRHKAGMQLALPLDPPQAPRLPRLGDWAKTIADYRSTGMTLDTHPMALLRGELGPEVRRSIDLERIDSGGAVEVAGMVVARQRPETAKGVVFMLLEDERGTVNLIVPPPVYERYRALVRAAPLVRARGRLERYEGTTNVFVAEVQDLEPTPAARQRVEDERRRPTGPAASKARRPSPQPGRTTRERAVAELRAVAPAGHSFGRRR